MKKTWKEAIPGAREFAAYVADAFEALHGPAEAAEALAAMSDAAQARSLLETELWEQSQRLKAKVNGDAD